MNTISNDGRDTFALVREWVVALHEPLISPADALRIDQNMRLATQRHPGIFDRLLTGLVADTLGTLPAADPWRSLSATWVGHHGTLTLQGAGRAGSPPPATGATGLAGPFGTFVDGTDLQPVTTTPLTADAALAPLADPLPASAAALIAFAGRGHSVGLDALRSAALTAEEMWDVCSRALRWVLWRRRTYVGGEDDLLFALTPVWWEIATTDLTEELDADRTEAVGFHQVSDGDYEYLRH